MPEKQTPRSRRVRPSRARGLRTSTGCLTCRKRRVKCDEKKPQCSQCGKADRDCQYPGRTRDESQESDSRGSSARADDSLHESAVPGTRSDVASSEADKVPEEASAPLVTHSILHTGSDLSPFDVRAVPVASVSFQIDKALGHNAAPVVTDPPLLTNLDAAFSPFTGSQTSLLNISPFEWYDLLAQDAITQIQRQAALNNGEHRWTFDETALSRRQSPVPFPDDASTAADHGLGVTTEPWNTLINIELSPTDRTYLEYYIEVVGPILDLFDPDRHFTNVVPHLAIRNVGLLKSILAVAARHKSIGSCHPVDPTMGEHPSPASLTQAPLESEHANFAAQYYYETLQYLSQNLLYPSYADSLEILATAIMISTYEMFDPNGSSNSGDLERHLRGAFWIQRCQDNNGETLDGLRRAVWWAWLRQDTWVAFRAGRPTLTIWRPVKRLEELNSNERATRILYVAAKCVEYAAGNNAALTANIQQRIDHGNRLLQTLSDWYNALPPSYRPLDSGSKLGMGSGTSDNLSVSTPGGMPPDTSGGPIFQSIWMHPPNHAGAMQMYHFARAAVLLNQPTTGGLAVYRRRQRTLNESLHTICGIASACRPTDHAMAFVNVQAVFAIGQCVQMREKQEEVVEILHQALSSSKFPATSLIDELKTIWQEAF